MGAVMGAGMGQPQYEDVSTALDVRTLRVKGDGDVVDDINAMWFDLSTTVSTSLVLFIHDENVYIWVGGERPIGQGQAPVSEDDIELLSFRVGNQISDISGLADALEKNRAFAANSLDTLEAKLRADFINRVNILSGELSAEVMAHRANNDPHDIDARIAQQVNKHLSNPDAHPNLVRPEDLNAFPRQGYAKLVHSGEWAPGGIWEDWHIVGGWIPPTVIGVGSTANPNFHGFSVQDLGLWNVHISLVMEHDVKQMNRSLGICLAQEGREELDTAVFGTQEGTSMTNINASMVIKIPNINPVQLKIMGGNEYRKVKILAGSMTMVKL